MFDIEKMIMQVKRRPILWNAEEKSYNDRFLKHKTWLAVAEECFEEWQSITSEEKQKKVLFVMKKWKYVRDYYIRENKKAVEDGCGSELKRRKICPYFDSLHFLKTIKQSKNSSSNTSTTSPRNINEDSNTSENNSTEDVNKFFESKAPQQSLMPILIQASGIQPEPSTSKLTCTAHEQPKTTPRQKLHLNKMENNDDDPNRHFLLSLLSDMSKMTERQNFEFRMQVMNVLNNVMFQIPDYGKVISASGGFEAQTEKQIIFDIENVKTKKEEEDDDDQ